MRILFTGGGTGGHVFPLVSVIRETRKLHPQEDLEFFYIGPKDDDFGSILISQETAEIRKIIFGKIRRYFSFQNFIDILFKIPFGFIQTLYYFARIDPNFVFSKGGSGSLPVVFWARVFKIPFFIHESDATPGLSNRIASRWAKKIFISFPKTEYFDLSKAILVGNPTRREILNGSKEIAEGLFELTLEKPAFLILGGSQGAEFINDFVLNNLNKLLSDYEIIHSCGIDNYHEVLIESQSVIRDDLKIFYHLYGFLDEEKIKHAYRASDFVISRAGSGSIFEISAVGIPSILIPLTKSAGDHQAKNAYLYAETGASIVLEEENMKPDFFFEKIHHIFADPENLKNMREAALRFSKPNAGKEIAINILEYLSL